MSSLNKIILVGEVDSDVDLRATQNGNQVAKFDLSVKRPENLNESIQTQKSDRFTVVSWDDLATSASNLQKGSFAIVEGRISNRSFETEMGRKYVTEIDARKIVALPSKNPSDTASDDFAFDSFSQTDSNLEQSNTQSHVDFNFDETPPDLAQALEDGQRASNQDIPF